MFFLICRIFWHQCLCIFCGFSSNQLLPGSNKLCSRWVLAISGGFPSHGLQISFVLKLFQSVSTLGRTFAKKSKKPPIILCFDRIPSQTFNTSKSLTYYLWLFNLGVDSRNPRLFLSTCLCCYLQNSACL